MDLHSEIPEAMMEELRVGAYHKFAQEVFPIIQGQPLMPAYLRVIGRPHQYLLDKVLEDFRALDQQAGDFWEEFESRVSDVLQSEFNIELEFAVSVKSKDKARLESVVSPLVNFMASFLKETGELVPVGTAIEKVLAKTQTIKSGNVFQKIGKYWIITYEGKFTIVDDREGMNYLAYLIHNQGRDFEFHDLVSAVEGQVNSCRRVSKQQAIADGLTPTASSYVKEKLRRGTREEYKREVQELTEELEEAGRLNNIGRVSDLRQKIEMLNSELLADYNRRAENGDPVGRYCKTVRARVRRVKEIIAKTHPSLGKYLATVKVGFISSYRPPQFTPWEQ